jgi:DNA-binding NarL/FixJ family response regulator
MCVDDNAAVCDAVRITVSHSEGMSFVGSLASAEGLGEASQGRCPDIILMDLDMPGPEPFEAMRELRERCPQTRVIVYTGHIRSDLIDRAFDAGAWGYVGKDEPLESMIRAIREVAAGRVAFHSPGPSAAHAGNGNRNRRDIAAHPGRYGSGPRPGSRGTDLPDPHPAGR